MPARTAKLAPVHADGTGHVAPVWVDLESDGAIVFMTGAETVKGPNLARTRRAARCFDDERPPFSFARLEGPVELVDVRPDELLDDSMRIAGRYRGADRARPTPPQRRPRRAFGSVPSERVVSAAALAD